MRRLQSLLIVCALLVTLAAGCGEDSVANGVTVTVYTAAPLCKGAKGGLGREGASAGGVRVRIVCLPPVERHGHADLARAGANARRTTEDSTSIAYLEAPGPGAKFSATIVEAAEIAWLETNSPSTTMRRILRALEDRGSSSPRDAVRELLSG